MPPDAASYIERKADTDLFETLQRGELCYVLNARQMGKSSLCIRTIQRLKAHHIRAVFLDLTKFGGSNLTPDQWYAALLAEVGRELNLRKECLQYFKQNTDFGPMQRFFGALHDVCLLQVEAPIVIFVDEIDVTRSLPFHTDEFFAGIRECYTSRATNTELNRLTFCLLGTATPAELIEDARITPFNIGKRIELSDFTPQEAAPFAKTLPGGMATLKRILYWTGGHPYLTQTLCRAIFNKECSPSETTSAPLPSRSKFESIRGFRASIDALVDQLFLSHTAQDCEANLTLVRDRLLRADCDQFALLTLYRQALHDKRVFDDDTDPLCDVLKLAGIVRVERGLLRVRNRIYRHVFDDDWVEKRLPGVEVRREKAAFRRGIWRSVLMVAYFNFVFVCIPFYLHFVIPNLFPGGGHKFQNITAVVMVVLMIVFCPFIIMFDWFRHPIQYFANRASTRKRAVLTRVGLGVVALAIALAVEVVTLQNFASGRPSPPLNASPQYGAVMAQLLEAWDEDNKPGLSQLLDSTRTAPEKGFEWGFWNLRTNLPLMTLPARDSGANPVVFSPSGEQTAEASADGSVRLWEIKSGNHRRTLPGQGNAIALLAYSPDGGRLAVGSTNGTITLWNLATGTVLFHLEKNPATTALAFSRDGTLLVTNGGKNTVRIYEGRTGKELHQLKGHTGPVKALAFSPDNRYVATGGADGTTKLWDTATGKEVRTLFTGHPTVNALAFSPDGASLVTAGDWRLVRGAGIEVWNVKDGKRRFTLERDISLDPLETVGNIQTIGFSHDGRRIIGGDSDENIWLWNARTGDPLLVLDALMPVRSVAFSPNDQRLMAALEDGSVKIFFSNLEDAVTLMSNRPADIQTVSR